MVRGSCLCGDVQFEVDQFVGPFELCHCSRCRKASGSAFLAAIGVRRADFRFVRGRESIRTFDAPIRSAPPAYRSAFCARCGSPCPEPSLEGEWFEIPAGSLEADPQLRPDRHIFTHVKSAWFEITDRLPQLDEAELLRLRAQGDGAHGSIAGAPGVPLCRHRIEITRCSSWSGT